MELKAYEVELGMKLAIAQNDIVGFNHYEGGKKEIIAKKGDTVKILQEFADHVYIQVDNWDFEVVVFPEEIKIEDTKIKEENNMKKLTVGMKVEVELNYSEVVGIVTEVSESDMFYMVDESGTLFKFYSDIHKVTIIDEAVFHGMENIEVINKEDFQYFDNAYKVSIHNYDNKFYGVYASCDQDALDIVVDYLEEKGMTGLFYDLDEVLEMEKDGYCDMFITAGNHCHNLDAEHVYIEQVK